MRFLRYIFGKTSTPIKAPESWGDVSFKTFMEFRSLESKEPIDIYNHFIKGVDWTKPHNPSLFKAMNEQLNFISEEPFGEVVTHLVYKDNVFNIEKEIEEMTLEQYWGMIKMIEGVETESDGLKAMPKMISVLCCKDSPNEKEVEKLSKQIELMPTDVIYPLGTFFLRKLNGSKNGTKRIYRLLHTIVHTFKLGIITLVLISVTFLRFITCRKGSYQSMISFLRKTWLKCTFRYSFPLFLEKQNVNTLI